MRPTILITVLLAAGAGCGSGSPHEDLFGPEVPAEDVVIDTRHSGIVAPVRGVIRSPTEWQPFLDAFAQATPGQAIRAVDFSTEMILVAALGRQLQAGRDIGFRGIQRVTAEIIAEVLLIQPDARCDTIEIETTPLVAVAIRRSDVPVRFVDVTRILEACP